MTTRLDSIRDTIRQRPRWELGDDQDDLILFVLDAAVEARDRLSNLRARRGVPEWVDLDLLGVERVLAKALKPLEEEAT